MKNYLLLYLVQTLVVSSVMYFTLDLNSFDLHIRLCVRLYFPGVGHLNSYLARGEGNLNTNFPKIQMPGGGGGGILKLRFEQYITVRTFSHIVHPRDQALAFHSITPYPLSLLLLFLLLCLNDQFFSKINNTVSLLLNVCLDRT